MVIIFPITKKIHAYIQSRLPHSAIDLGDFEEEDPPRIAYSTILYMFVC